MKIYAFLDSKGSVCRFGRRIMLTTRLEKCVELEREVKKVYRSYRLVEFVEGREVSEEEMIKALYR